MEVTYSFDKTGRISVTAREKTSNHEAKIDIERHGTLSEDEVVQFTELSSEYVVE